jgi:hypothetical protein
VVVVVVVKVGRCFFARVEDMGTVEVWHPHPFCVCHGSKLTCPAGYWYDWALVMPVLLLAVELRCSWWRPVLINWVRRFEAGLTFVLQRRPRSSGAE